MPQVWKFCLLGLMAIALAGCVSMGAHRNPVPLTLMQVASVGGSAPLRYWGDDPDFVSSHRRIRPGSDGRVDYLALSGGGINGAYGAGYLVGWTARRDRPDFEVVTGISVGAIMAPLAFLGPHHDARLQRVFSSLTEASNPATNFLSALLGAPSIMSNAPVLAAIRAAVDEPLLDEVGRAHREGRRLYIGTTDFDAQRPVIWDIGAIANSGLPNRLQLVHNILLASAAVPGVFPPVLIKVTAQGQQFEELHVDGGLTQQVLVLPGGFGRAANGTTARLYVIFNGVTAPTPSAVQISSMSLLQRAVPTLLKYLGRANLVELANSARQSGASYRITAIPAEFPESRNVFGSPQWLESLYGYGYQSGLAGAWQTKN